MNYDILRNSVWSGITSSDLNLKPREIGLKKLKNKSKKILFLGGAS